MLGEIDDTFYCSCNFVQMGEYEPKHCLGNTKGFCGECSAMHRKHPTPEQFKEEYGGDIPESFPVWCKSYEKDNESKEWGKWFPATYSYAEDYLVDICPFTDGEEIDNFVSERIVCACTPWGKPPDDRRPQ